VLLLSEQSFAAGIVVFRDHSSPSTFHYVSSTPRFVADSGRPGVQLLMFRSSNRSGGILLIDGELTPEADVLEKARQELSERFGVGASLVPALFNRGAVRAVTLDAAPRESVTSAQFPARFVERTLGTAIPSLDRLRFSFSISLTPEAAALMEAALSTGELPVVVVYDLQIPGLQPSRGLRARVKYHMAYDYLRTRFATNTLYFKADIDREAETLRKQALIDIEDVDYQGLDAKILAERQVQVRATLDDLMQSLYFTKTASPATQATSPTTSQTSADAYWASQGRPQAAFTLRALAQDEQQNLTYDLRQARVANWSIAPQASVRLPPHTDTSKLILHVTGDWPPPINQVRASVVPRADWTGVSAIQVDVRQQSDVRSIVLSAEKGDGTAALQGGTVEYRLQVVRKEDSDILGEPPKVPTEFTPLTTSNLVLDPAALSGRRDIHISAGVVDFNVISKIVGEVAVEGKIRGFVLDGVHPEVTVAVRGQAPASLKAELRLIGGDSFSIQQEVLPQQKFALINQPPGRLHPVTLMLQDPVARFARIFVEMEAAEGGTRRVVDLDSLAPVKTWSAPRSERSPGTFRYRVRQVLRNNSTIEGGWQDGSGSLLVVGDLKTRVEQIQVMLLGATNLLGGILQLKSTHPPQGLDGTVEVVLDPGTTALTVPLPFDSEAQRQYSVAAQVFLEQGPLELVRENETGEVLLLSMKPASA
jgi:hypothetical protein